MANGKNKKLGLNAMFLQRNQKIELPFFFPEKGTVRLGVVHTHQKPLLIWWVVCAEIS